ncbi:peroxisomal membrane protein PEX13-like [Panonychus citri]|uniref:peroxisomal membrane protein PEX13-like n=1 Tax=Panonychus citri TaxID=50023 RepID=UPI002306E279|nr:peroxisomal membrane protein PEX13-like [Panonychus citri]
MTNVNSNSDETTGHGPPPVPARPFHNSISRPWNSGYSNYGFGGNYNRFNGFTGLGYGGGYGGYGAGGFAGYGGGYGGYGAGGYGSGYGGFGPSIGNDFIRIAEETCGQSFQSLESVVQSVSSVAMMLESTYFAVHSSFRAVLGVAHHISSLKDQLSQFTNQIPIVRFLLSVVKKILYFLGIISSNSLIDHERAWREATSANIRLNADGTFNPFLSGKDPVTSRSSSLPILIFFGLVLGAPWMIWTLLKRSTRKVSHVNTEWSIGKDEHYIGQALYPFTTNSQGELPLTTGQKILIAPKDIQPKIGDWLLAAIDGQIGLVPANYIKIIEYKPSSNQQLDDQDKQSQEKQTDQQKL